VRYAELIDALKHFAEREEIDIDEMDEISTTFLVKKNVLFVDPVRGVIKPQSRLNLHAIQELMN
jgi:AAA+ ATPase superfamily predicted ATPase